MVVVVVGPGLHLDLDRIEARVRRLSHGKPRPADGLVEHLDDRSADHAGEGRVATEHGLSRDPSLLTRVGAERYPCLAAAHPVGRCRAVACRENPVDAGPHRLVDPYGTPGAELHTCLGGEPDRRADADGEQHDVRFDFAGGGRHGGESAVRVRRHRLDARHQAAGDSFFLDGRLYQ